MRVLKTLPLLFLASRHHGVLGKTVSGSVQLTAGDLTHGPEHEVTKYSFAIGTGTVEGTFRYEDPKTWQTSPALYLFMDESWDAYHNAPACTDKVAAASASIPIGSITRSHMEILKNGLGKATTSKSSTLGDGKVEWRFSWSVDHETRTHGWFLVIADCALEQYNAQVPPMEYNIKLLNPGNTHLPADEYGLPKMYLAVFILMAAYAVYLWYVMCKQEQKSRNVHLVVKMLVVGYAIQWVSILYELIHLAVYRNNGSGLLFFDFMSEVLEGMSQTLIAFVLICLASGWTLVDTEYDRMKANSIGTLLRDPSNLVKGSNSFIFVIIIFMLVTFVLQVLNKLNDDNFTKFHDHESTPGKALLLLRFLLGLAFVYSLHVTIKFQETRGGDKLVDFLKRLRLLGGLWFLSFPVLVFFAEMFPHYYRHRIVSTGVLTLQTSILAVLGFEFINESSTYFKISILANSGVLPGAGGLVRAPKAMKD